VNSTTRYHLSFDISAVSTSGEALCQTAWAFVPHDPTTVRAAIVALPGGTYDKQYWHLDVPGRDGYSFGEHLARQGYIVVAVDHLGTGCSTDPVHSGPVGLELLAAGDSEVARLVRARLGDGSLAEGVPPLTVPLVGVGHSMGSCLTTMVQATSSAFDAVVLLGYGVDVTNVHDGPDVKGDFEEKVEQSLAILRQAAGVGPEEVSALVPREPMVPMFYGDDVPEDVIAADVAAQSRVPVRAASEVITPGFVEHYTPKVRVPVFLGFGAAIDVSPNPYAEPGNYTGSTDVTLCLIPGSGHCHNMCSRRAELWDRIAAWIPSVVT
jgi:pimeloyl-ACP methyl ester carboxylesterase